VVQDASERCGISRDWSGLVSSSLTPAVTTTSKRSGGLEDGERGAAIGE